MSKHKESEKASYAIDAVLFAIEERDFETYKKALNNAKNEELEDELFER